MILKEMRNHLDKKKSLILFCLSLLFFTLTTFLICSELFVISRDTKIITIKVVISIAFIGWFSFSISGHEDIKRLSINSGIVSFFFVPVILLESTHLSIFFYISLIVFSCSPLHKAYNSSDKFCESIIKSIYVVSSIVSLIVVIGSNIFTYAREVAFLSEINMLLDLRYSLTIVFLCAILINAISKSVRSNKPIIKPLPVLSFPDVSKQTNIYLAQVVRPLIIVFNQVIVIFTIVADLLWKLVVTVCVYVARIGQYYSDYILELIKLTVLWKDICWTVFCFLAMVLLSYVIEQVAPQCIDYLTAPDAFYETSLLTIISLRNMIGLFCLGISIICGISFAIRFAFLTIIVTNLHLRYKEGLVLNALFYGAMLVILWFSTGVFLYMMGQVSVLKVRGFEKFGIFIVGIFSIAVIGLIYRLLKSPQIFNGKGKITM